METLLTELYTSGSEKNDGNGAAAARMIPGDVEVQGRREKAGMGCACA